MGSEVTQTKSNLFLNELDVGVTKTIVVMVCRIWDNDVIGHYLSTDFIVSDATNWGKFIIVSLLMVPPPVAAPNDPTIWIHLLEGVITAKGLDKAKIVRILAGQLITVLLEGVITAKGLDKAKIVRILAGQLITVVAMADASSLFDFVIIYTAMILQELDATSFKDFSSREWQIGVDPKKAVFNELRFVTVYSSPAKTKLLDAVEATTSIMVLLDDPEGINSVGFSS
uniref:Uncharacterized protein n=1 Tax=Tanacetum cinerariifolium TaxID=118510 RepID=A0A6L2P4K3_TANCI|nr:hypothetical protein [Tanacetum cinerariifolium]